ncbi:MAG TPA: hypothetical protein VHD88_08565 [Pyrinomonadaceae bacterium]|nr:hypothetical protein [Pyrinomonadaceae bacterium]
MSQLISGLDEQFALIHRRSCELIDEIPPALLYRKTPVSNSSSGHSCGEQILRSAAIVEQTFGGITANLWDDAFEWTLPENLATCEKVRQYLDEVEATRRRGFELFHSDDDLMKEIMAPTGKTQLLTLLMDTIARAVHHQGNARITFEMMRPKN